VTEDEWLDSRDLRFLKQCLFRKFDNISERRMRLFGCACCRRIWPMLVDDRTQRAVDVAESFADGSLSRKELAPARQDAFEAFREIQRATAGPGLAMAARAAAQTVVPNGIEAGRFGADYAAQATATARYYGTGSANKQPIAVWYQQIEVERCAQVPLFRDVFGNPFRPMKLDPSCLAWRQGAIPALARSIAEHLDFDRMPILAGMLEEAGCTATELLRHCREPAIHVRGCWALDCILGRK
jgi:hypothetical protein